MFTSDFYLSCAKIYLKYTIFVYYFRWISMGNDSSHFLTFFFHAHRITYRTYSVYGIQNKEKFLPSMAHINISATMATPRKLHIKPMKYIIHRVHNGIFVSSISGNTYPYLVFQTCPVLLWVRSKARKVNGLDSRRSEKWM